MRSFTNCLVTTALVLMGTCLAYGQCNFIAQVGVNGSTNPCPGSAPTLTASIGVGYNIQWIKNGIDISGATGFTYMPGSSGNYAVRISHSACAAKTSPPVTITFRDVPDLSVPYTSSNPLTVDAGGNVTSCGSFTATANTSAGISFQWTKNGSTIPGATSNAYTITSTGTYRVITTNAFGCSTFKQIPVVGILEIPSASVNPASGNICSGASISLFASTGSGYTYQWRRNDVAIPWATNNNLSVDQTGNYHVTVSKDICFSNSNVVPVTVNPFPSASITPVGSTTVCGSAVTLNANSGAGYTYQWTLNGNTIGGATSGSYNATQSGLFRVVVTSNGCSSTSTGVNVTINPNPVAVINPQGATTVCAGTPFPNLQASSSSGIQWFRNGSPVGATGTVYSPTSAGSYTITVTLNGCTSTSAPVVLSTIAAPVLTTSYQAERPMSVDGNGNVSSCGPLTITANADAGVSFQWRRNGVIISGATTNTYAVTTSATYQVTATNGSGCSTSRQIPVTLLETPSAAVAPVSGDICEGASLTLTAPTGSGYTYQWEKNGVYIPWETSNNLSVDQTGNYRVTVSKGMCFSNSNVVPVTVHPFPDVVLSPPGDVSGCEALTLHAPEVAGNTYAWYKNGVVIQNEATSAYTVTESGAYGVTITNEFNCTASSAASNVTIYPFPTATVSVVGSAVISPGQLGPILTSSPASSYEWLKNDVVIPQATGSSYQAGSAGNYRVRITSNGCSSLSSEIVITTGLSVNLVREDRTLVPEIIDKNMVSTLPVEQNSVTNNYFDGLGRPIQKVTKQSSPQAHDAVMPMAYDAFGREAFTYLPYVSPAVSGDYQADALSDQQQFYENGYDNIVNDDRPFAERIFEPSPLNRVSKQYGPGEAWGPAASNKFNSFQFLVNTFDAGSQQHERIIAWTVTAANMPVRSPEVSNIVEEGGYYATGQLYINVTIDEEGHFIREYKTRDGLLILKKLQVMDDPALDNENHWAQTYYIYDEQSNLRFVLQPELVMSILANNTNAPATADLNDLAFQYHYDGRNRMIGKRTPGAEPVYMVYDNRDRLVLTQDGNQRSNTSVKYWTFTKYDALNRPVMTGILDTTAVGTRDVMQTAIDQHYSKSWTKWCETFTTSAGNVHGYSNRSYPVIPDPDKCLTVTYYDTYEFRSDWQGVYGYADDDLNVTVNGISYTQPGNARTKASGFITGTKSKILDDALPGAGTWLKSVSYYDDRYRMIQMISDSYYAGKDTVSMLYDFTGKVLKTKKRHNGRKVMQTYAYDHAGRLTKTWHRIDEQDSVLLAWNEYNELGQLVTKKLSQTGQNSGVETLAQVVDYRYNIRSWLTRINNSDLSPDNQGDPQDYFGMNLVYNEQLPSLVNTPAFNGNISAIQWSTNLGLGITDPQQGISEPKENAYTFSYDTLNRLKSASFHTKASAWSTSAAYHENNLKYDLNGNIRTLHRTTAEGAPMDQLSYTYSGNRLLKVGDAADKTRGFIDGANADNDYAYDANGNMSLDKNKDITVTYSHLNLPGRVTKSTGDYIQYTYDATGRKLRQDVYNASNVLQKRTDYAGEFFYENDTLKFISHEEGRVVMTGTEPEYQYHLKDHLGNVRMTFTTRREVSEYSATLEDSHIAEERADFPNYDDVFISPASIYNHTVEPNATRSVALNGAEGKQVGLAKSLKVVPGDTIDMKVYAKYFVPNPGGQPAVGTSIISAITGAFGLSANSTGPEYSAFQSLSGIFDAGWFIGPGEWEDDNAPKAYLNYILFDEDFIPYDMGWDQIDAHADATHPHDTLNLQAIARKPGYAYIYFSNEDNEIVETFFDDFKIEHIKSPVIQANDYYPFGLTFNSYQRENSVDQKYKFQNQEHIDDLGLNWDQFKWRNHMPDIGRFFNVDPLAHKYVYNSPYAFSENKVTTHVELEGLEAFFIHGTTSSPGRWRENKNTIPTLMKLTNNKTHNADFKWKAPLNNDEKTRAKAAVDLATHIMKNRVKGEEITLIGHSHGGNVAIQASKLIQEQTGEKVNIITIATPAYNDKGDAENPETQKASINDHIAIWNKIDGVSGGLAGDDNYTNSSATTNAEVNVDQYYSYKKEVNAGRGETTEQVRYDAMGAHSFDVEHPETIGRTKIRRLKPVVNQ